MRSPRRPAGRVLSLVLALSGLAPSARAEEPSPAPERWIAVVAPALREAVAPLVERRRLEGLEVALVWTQDVLDEAAVRAGEAEPLRERVAALVRGAKGRSSVLLVGAARADAWDAVVPPLRGTVDRMAGKPSDNGYGRLGESVLPDVAVGRLPARTADEARTMVAKTLAFEDRAGRASWRDRISLVVGHPGGSSALERRLASGFVDSALESRIGKVHERWRVRATVHTDSSPFGLPGGRLGEVARRWAEEGQLLLVYLGHSSASALWSNGVDFLSGTDWAAMRSPAGQGLFFTCGCHACDADGGDPDGYAVAGIRAAGGPVAVIGAQGESYGALGELATDGLLTVVSEAAPPARLGDWWLAVARGIAEAEMSAVRFLLYDRADGSGGKVPLDVQRLEHLERWMLLGDPALRLPVDPPEVRLDVEASEGDGHLLVRGALPARLAAATVRVALERPFGSEAPDLPEVPEEEGPAREGALVERHARANQVELASAQATAVDGRFECRLPLPEEVPWERLVVRVRGAGGEGDAEVLAAVGFAVRR